MVEETDYAVTITTLVAATLSLIGSSTILLSYVLYSRGVGISKMIMFLAISDLGWSIVEIVAFSIILSDPSQYTTAICKIARCAFQFFSGAAVMWSMCIGIFLFRTVVASNPNSADVKKSKKSLLVYHLISWGIPVIQCIVIFVPKKTDWIIRYPTQHICAPMEPYLGLFWFLPIFLAIVASATLYAIFIRRIFRRTQETDAGAYHHLPFRLTSYVLVLFVCWIPNIVAYGAGVHRWSYVMSIVNGLLEFQGAFDCIVYGFTNREFRRNFTGLKSPFQILFSPILLPFATIYAIFKWCRKKRNKRNSMYSPILNKKVAGASVQYHTTMDGSYQKIVM